MELEREFENIDLKFLLLTSACFKNYSSESCFLSPSYFFGTFLVGLARAIWILRRPEVVFPVDRLVNSSQHCPRL